MSVHTQCLILPSLYRDSVVLMQLSHTLESQPHIHQAAVMMGTPQNRDLLREAGLFTPEAEASGPNDLLICVQADSPETADAALQQARSLCMQQQVQRDETDEPPPRTLATALRRMPDANLVCISVPGPYAHREVRRALERGLHVFLFSDHVDLETERALKHLASERGLLLMGPDCGTAMIRGMPLGFANQWPSGPVGLIAASGTGLQQVGCLLAHQGVGISHALGVGGRDLHRDLGGHSMRAALQALARDADTRVIVLISKPPDPEVASVLAHEAATCGKACVLAFMGDDQSRSDMPGVHRVTTLAAAADAAAALARGESPTLRIEPLPAHLVTAADQARKCLHPEQRLVHGLYCGGTLAAESLWLLRRALTSVDSNLDGSYGAAHRHTVLDLGDEAFTSGRPHPMIDPTVRRQHLLQLAEQPDLAVVLCDVMLGWGAHEAPGDILAAAWREMRASMRQHGRQIIGIATICGAPDDPQNDAQQRRVLEEQGWLLTDSNAQAARLAAYILGVPPDSSAWRDHAAPSAAPPTVSQPMTQAPEVPAQLPALLREGPRVINIGLKSFAAQLQACGAFVRHVDWQPPASGNTQLANLLERLK